LLRRTRLGTASAQDWISPEALELLQNHSWPGNVRELANVIEYATILCEQLPVLPDHLPNRFEARRQRTAPLRVHRPLSLREIEMQAILAAIDRHSGNKPQAAEELGISLKTLYNKLNHAEAGTAEKAA
jgi:two-component system NtrC family response regulator